VAARLTAATDPARAVRLHSRAEDVLAEGGHDLYDDDLRASQEMLGLARAKLGDEEFEHVREEGHALGLPEAAARARDALDEVLT
jgi:hypothetical protein